MLTLGQVEEGNDAGLFVVGGIFGEDFVDVFVVLFGVVEVCFGSVVRGVDVLWIGGKSRQGIDVGSYYEMNMNIIS
jgi:hypothetical protein